MNSSRAPTVSPYGESVEAAAFHWLANERYRVLLTARATGFSAFEDYLLTAWRPDAVEDGGGIYIYLRDLETREFWTVSGSAVPGQAPGRVATQPDRAVIERARCEVSSSVAVQVLGNTAVELRVCTLKNESSRPRRLELTSFIEVVLNDALEHERHPAFSRLFVQTAWLPRLQTLTAKRRPRGNAERPPAMMHALLGAPVTGFETDRARFIGRGQDKSCPRALIDPTALSGTAGSVLDPALSLRTVLSLEPGETRTVVFMVGAARDHVELFDRIEDWTALDVTALLGRAAGAHLPATPALAECDDDRWRNLVVGFDDDGSRVQQAPELQPPSRTDIDQGMIEPLQFFNGYGGFSADGREYVMRLPRDACGRPLLPPAPWVNVVANDQCGLLVSEKGAGALWSRNSRLYRLTPWRNDPISDPHGDAFYVRDDDSGTFWSPLPGPMPPAGDFEVRHGFGYSTWSHSAHELEQQVCLFIAERDPMRIARIRVRNLGTRVRRLSLYAYNRWVLGERPEETRAAVTTEFSTSALAVLARNPAAGEFATGIAFATADQVHGMSWSADRDAFLGSPGSTGAPLALRRDGKLRPARGADPCAVVRVTLEIPPGETGQIAFFLGEAGSMEGLASLLAAYRLPGAVDAALEQIRAMWARTLKPLRVRTPSAALDLMVNGWLSYQNLSCRLWGRTASYQSAGALGFRDQIQDAAALVYLRPDLTRRQLLLHAAHQFVEGDVLHWWHPPLGKGIRTRFADDFLWLPYLTAHYIEVTGDRPVMAEQVRFVTGAQLASGEDEIFLEPVDSGESADLYEHCCRALDRSLTSGSHGIPLFGTGDWNDGMNRVGRDGRGESVWMGFFLYTILGDFLPWCEARSDQERTVRYSAYRQALLTALNDSGWDGEWYLRGWYDNGAPLGSSASDECRIDALVQAWAVISKAAPRERAALALDAVEKYLVDERGKLVRLLTPPFVNTPNDPGYIKGYVAGVRENGGQYTHAALWVVRAMAEAGRRDRAMQLMEMLNPINHSSNRADADRYRVEPYVIAADVYGIEPHVGRGGWTWYTGSAGWMYRVTIETLLGFNVENGDTLRLSPRIPDSWPEYQIEYRLDDGTSFDIKVRNPEGCAARIVNASLDGTPLVAVAQNLRIPLRRSGRAHKVLVALGK